MLLDNGICGRLGDKLQQDGLGWVQ
jgi:hypothetical protein